MLRVIFGWLIIAHAFAHASAGVWSGTQGRSRSSPCFAPDLACFAFPSCDGDGTTPSALDARRQRS